jgi:DNA-binding transcriptional MerR regulator
LADDEGQGMLRKLFTSGQVAEQVGRTRAGLLYLIESGQIPGPSVQVPGRRLFTEDDVRRIAEALAARDKQKD